MNDIHSLLHTIAGSLSVLGKSAENDEVESAFFEDCLDDAIKLIPLPVLVSFIDCCFINVSNRLSMSESNMLATEQLQTIKESINNVIFPDKIMDIFSVSLSHLANTIEERGPEDVKEMHGYQFNLKDIECLESLFSKTKTE